MSLVDYTRSFLDPFDSTFTQPKLFDGSVTRSSGLKFRSTGNITLDATGADNFLIIYPGLSTGFAWAKASDTAYTNINTYPTHLGSTANRDNLRRARLVSSGLRLSLLNSSDDNEGYWEAIRIPAESLVLGDNAAPVGEDYVCRPTISFMPTGFANYNTFQTGRLRDIHRFLFKLNSVAPDHPFKEILPSSASPTVGDTYDHHFDIVVIRIVGRIDATTPSMLQYDFVSNQEVVYKDDTVMARLATMNTMVPDLDVLLDKTRFILPAIQIA